jgi:multimeric flavodoxin WrbA
MLEKFKGRYFEKKFLAGLAAKKRVLFLTTSNRWSGGDKDDKPKSTRLAEILADKAGRDKVEIIDVPSLNIYPCEGNVSAAAGNNCGAIKALLKDKTKNPSGCHRCWASVNNQDDELWKISRPLLESDCVVFFASVRWGQANACYQKLLERLTWLENRHVSLGEDNILKNISAGVVLVGHNWRADKVLDVHKQVLKFFGFRVAKELCWSWQYTHDAFDESNSGYRADRLEFFKMLKNLK